MATLEEWAATDEARASTWTLPVPGGSRRWMTRGALSRDAGVGRAATAISVDGTHGVTVAWAEAGATVRLDGRAAVPLAGGRGFDAVIPPAMEFATGVSVAGAAVVVQAVHIEGKPGLVLNRWAVKPKGAAGTAVARLAPLSVGRDVYPVAGSLCVADVSHYMTTQGLPATVPHQRPHWCVTWAAWNEAAVHVSRVGGKRLSSRITSATVQATYLHTDGVTLASPSTPFAVSAPVTSMVSDWHASVQILPPHNVPVTTVWCADVVLTAWPSPTFPGFKDTTRVAAAPWCRDVKDRVAVDTPVACLCVPAATARDSSWYAFVASDDGDADSLRLLMFSGGWPAGGTAAVVHKPLTTADDQTAVATAARRAGLPSVAVLAATPDNIHVAVMRARGDDRRLAWAVVTTPRAVADDDAE